MTPSQAIAQAKASYKLPPREPKVGQDEVILRHLWHAIELVSGMSDVRAMQRLNDALRCGNLVAHAHSNGAIIPSPTWPKAETTNGGGAARGWLTGVIFFDHDLPGFGGELPVVGRKEAESWLSTLTPTSSPGRPSKRLAAGAVYRNLYPNGHEAVDATWKEVALRVGQRLGQPVSIKSIQRGLGFAK